MATVIQGMKKLLLGIVALRNFPE